MKPWLRKQSPHVHWEVIRYDDRAYDKGTPPMGGRHMLFLFLRENRADDTMVPVASIEQFMALEYPGDHKMEEFFQIFCDWSEQDENPLTDKVKCSCLFKKLQGKSPDLAHQLTEFDLQDDGHPNKSLDQLLKIIRGCISRKKLRGNTFASTEEHAKLLGMSVPSKTLENMHGAVPATEQNPKKRPTKAEKKALAAAKAAPGPETPGCPATAGSDGKGGGKNGGKTSGKERTDEELQKICLKFQSGECKRDPKDCWEHTKLPAKQKTRLEHIVKEKAERKNNLAATPPPDPKVKVGLKNAVKMYCESYAKTGTCTVENRTAKFHVGTEEAESLEKEFGMNGQKIPSLVSTSVVTNSEKGKGKGKGKGKDKGKGKL